MFSVKWGEIAVTRGYDISIVEMRGHTPANMSKGGVPRPLLRRGAVSPSNVPEKK